MTRLLIVEDEASILDRLTRLTRAILGDRLQKLTTATTIDEAEAALAREPVDVLLLDLNLNGKDGFDLLKSLVARPFHTIVVSAYPQRAIEAYDLGVIDFVTKPFDEERLARSFERVWGSAALRDHFAKFLAVKQAGRIELVPIEEIECIRADGPCSVLVTTSGQERRHDKMLKDLGQILPPSFERAHKSYLVNLSAISGLENGENRACYARFRSGRQAPLSRSKAIELKARLQV